MRRRAISSILFFLLIVITGAHAQKKITVYAGKPGASVSPQMWGVFFEDINFGADGGLYAELVKNRSFEFPIAMMGWKQTMERWEPGRILVINRSDNSSNARFARITLNQSATKCNLVNEGFRGMGFHKEKQYDLSIMIRSAQPSTVQLKVQLLNYSGKIIGETVLNNFSNDWKKYSANIITTDTAQRGKLNLIFEGNGVIDIDMASLFPHDTWKNRPGGLRNDLAQMIADLKPGFIRFPGGCIVEGREISNRYQWKTTVGNVPDRTLIMNRWNVEFAHRPAPDYYQSFGLGFYEYFLLSEDVGAEPLPILNCGMACQFNSAEVVAMDELQPYINDALDLIEFANGDVSTQWGKLRSDMGHPSPFNLKMIGVGNEQWDPQYIERYKVFEKAIRSKYPAIKIVSGAGPFAEGDLFNYAWKELKQLEPSFIDEHYYKPPQWFLDNAGRYDNYERTGPKVFAGEYAAHVKGNPVDGPVMNDWESALAEAAFMTGLERNADVVQMCSYAPLFAHVDAWQWRPDLIWFDNLRSMATPNYYVQKLFSNNKGTTVIPVLENGQALAGKDSVYASSVVDSAKSEIIIKLVNISSNAMSFEISIDGVKAIKKEGVTEELYSSNLKLYNTVDQPKNICPFENKISTKGKKVMVNAKPQSLTVVKLPCEF